MTLRTPTALLCAGLASLVVVTGCSKTEATQRTDSSLRLIDLPIVSGGDEHDEIGTSENGRWWVIARYPSNRVVRVNIASGVITRLPGLRRATGAAYTITNAGHVGRPAVPPPHTDLLVFRTEQGRQVSVHGHAVYVSERPGNRGRLVARGYPRLEVEQEPSFSNGSLSGDGETVTIPTNRSYDPKDRNHDVDVYQLNLRTGRSIWVSRGSSFGGRGVAASPSGRYVVFDGSLPPPAHSGKSTSTASDAPLRWDRRTRRTTPVLSAQTRGPRYGVTGQFSIADDGTVAFVSNDCGLNAQPRPKGAEACLYVSQPVRS